MSRDFSTPYVAARLVTKDGASFPFWTDVANIKTGTFDATTDSPLKSLAFLQEVVVDMDMGSVPHITVTLAPPFRDALDFLDSELIEWGRTTVEVQFGYVGGKDKLSQVFSGVMMQPDITIGEDVSVAINAIGVGGGLAKSEGTSNSNGLTRRQYLQQLARGQEIETSSFTTADLVNGIAARPTSLNFTEADKNGAAKAALDTELFVYSQGGKTYAQSILEIAEQCHCTWRVEPDGGMFTLLPYDGITAAKPKRILRLYDFPGGAIGPVAEDSGSGAPSEVYPILSVSSSSGWIYIPAAIRGLVLKNISDEGRKATTSTHDDTTVKQERTGDGDAAPASSPENPVADPATGDGGRVVPGNPENPSDVATVESMYRREGNAGVELVVETLGIPDILPGEVVRIEGIGKRLGGNVWEVHKVTQTIGLSGFSTSLTLMSNSTLFKVGGPAAAGNVNKQEASAEGSDTSAPTTTGQGV